MTVKTTVIEKPDEDSLPALVEMAKRLYDAGDKVMFVRCKPESEYSSEDRQQFLGLQRYAHNTGQWLYTFLIERNSVAYLTDNWHPDHVILHGADRLTARKYSPLVRRLKPTKTWIESRKEATN